MAEQFLNRADVVARLRQMRGEAVAQDVRRHRLRDARAMRRARDRALDDLLVEMVPPAHPIERIRRAASRWKDVLPRP